VQGVLLKLLDRNPDQRLSSSALLSLLEEDLPTSATLNGGRTLNADGAIYVIQQVCMMFLYFSANLTHIPDGWPKPKVTNG
jgi:hypothetical protein